jgi:hypothetical protein
VYYIEFKIADYTHLKNCHYLTIFLVVFTTFFFFKLLI